MFLTSLIESHTYSQSANLHHHDGVESFQLLKDFQYPKVLERPASLPDLGFCLNLGNKSFWAMQLLYACVPRCAPVCTWELGLIDRMARSPLFGARHRSRESGVRRLQVRAARCSRVTPEHFWSWKKSSELFGSWKKSPDLFWSWKTHQSSFGAG